MLELEVDIANLYDQCMLNWQRSAVVGKAVVLTGGCGSAHVSCRYMEYGGDSPLQERRSSRAVKSK